FVAVTSHNRKQSVILHLVQRSSLMKAVINNFRKVEKAELTIDTITFLGGNNEAGKTSVSQSIAAALLGNPTVLGVTKKDALKLVRDGSKYASAAITGADGGEAKVMWPSMEVEANGTAPRASAFAVGVSKFTHLHAQEAAGLISKLMDA